MFRLLALLAPIAALSTSELRPKVEELGERGLLRVPCSQFAGGASTADENRYVCAKEVPHKLFNANANRAELFNTHKLKHSTMFQCSPAAVPEGVYSDPTRMLDAHVYELEAKKTGHSPCPSDKEFVIAGIAQVEVPTCACNVYTGGVQPEPDSIMCETVKPSVLFGTVKSRVECSPTNEDDSAVGGEAGGAETYHRCRSDSTPCIVAEMTTSATTTTLDTTTTTTPPTSATTTTLDTTTTTTPPTVMEHQAQVPVRPDVMEHNFNGLPVRPDVMEHGFNGLPVRPDVMEHGFGFNGGIIMPALCRRALSKQDDDMDSFDDLQECQAACASGFPSSSAVPAAAATTAGKRRRDARAISRSTGWAGAETSAVWTWPYQHTSTAPPSIGGSPASGVWTLGGFLAEPARRELLRLVRLAVDKEDAWRDCSGREKSYSQMKAGYKMCGSAPELLGADAQDILRDVSEKVKDAWAGAEEEAPRTVFHGEIIHYKPGCDAVPVHADVHHVSGQHGPLGTNFDSTLIIYLNDSPVETVFPKAVPEPLRVPSKGGNAVTWLATDESGLQREAAAHSVTALGTKEDDRFVLSYFLAFPEVSKRARERRLNKIDVAHQPSLGECSAACAKLYPLPVEDL